MKAQQVCSWCPTPIPCRSVARPRLPSPSAPLSFSRTWTVANTRGAAGRLAAAPFPAACAAEPLASAHRTAEAAGSHRPDMSKKLGKLPPPAAAHEEAREELFASCSFADLGLHHTLCAHLQGRSLSSFTLFFFLVVVIWAFGSESQTLLASI